MPKMIPLINDVTWKSAEYQSAKVLESPRSRSVRGIGARGQGAMAPPGPVKGGRVDLMSL